MDLDPLALANAAPDARTFERETLASLGASVGFDAAFFAVPGEPPTTVGLDAAKLERAFTSHRFDHELLPLKRAALAKRGVAVDTAVFGESAVRAMGYHRELAAPVGGRHSLMAYLVLRGRPVGALMLGRTSHAFTATDIEAVERVLPALTVGRASFPLSWRGGPLPAASPRSLGERLRASLGRDIELARSGIPPEAIVVRDRTGYREMVAIRGGRELVWTRSRLDAPSRSG